MARDSADDGYRPQPPDVVAVMANGGPLQLVWKNEIGALTFELGTGADRRFVKWLPRRPDAELAEEIARLRWAAGYITVPQILSTGSDASATWMVTAALPGENAISDRWKANPAAAATAIGAGLRRMHDSLPVADCPFSWKVEDRLADARRRAELGLIDPNSWHEDHQPLGLAEALALVSNPPPVDRLVVCHGDACSPNTLIGEDGSCTGHTDLADLGVADRWADLAVATWSTVWNFGEGFEHLVLEAYGIGADPERTAYYRLLWDLDP